jgi:glyoxylase-like metal-dependent hydrolase (beta-lactamase superfamily II)
MHGPPAYFTTDWQAAGESTRLLADLAPDVLVSGHGRPARGPVMTAALRRLAAEFRRVAVPHADVSKQ